MCIYLFIAARKPPKMPPRDAVQKAFSSVRWRKRGTSLSTLGKELTTMDASKASIFTAQEHFKDAMVRFYTSSDYFDALKHLEDVSSVNYQFSASTYVRLV